MRIREVKLVSGFSWKNYLETKFKTIISLTTLIKSLHHSIHANKLNQIHISNPFPMIQTVTFFNVKNTRLNVNNTPNIQNKTGKLLIRGILYLSVESV